MESQISKLHMALGAYEALNKYILDGEMRVALSALGEVGVDAAKDVLDSAKFSKNPREQVLLAIGHLKIAQSAYKKQWNINLILARASIAPFCEAVQEYILTTFLISACYSWCGETNLAREELKKADACKAYNDRVIPDAKGEPGSIERLKDAANVFVPVLLPSMANMVNPNFWLKGFSGTLHFPWDKYYSLRSRASSAASLKRLPKL